MQATVWIGGKPRKMKDALGTARALMAAAEELAQEQDRRCLPLSAERLRKAAVAKANGMEELVREVRAAVFELRTLHSGPTPSAPEHRVWPILRRAEAALAGVS